VENPDDDADSDWFQTYFIRTLLAKRQVMRMAHAAAEDDNGNEDNEDEECPAGYDYCIRRVCHGN
jgi:hypothetical protein